MLMFCRPRYIDVRYAAARQVRAAPVAFKEVWRERRGEEGETAAGSAVPLDIAGVAQRRRVRHAVPACSGRRFRVAACLSGAEWCAVVALPRARAACPDHLPSVRSRSQVAEVSPAQEVDSP